MPTLENDVAGETEPAIVGKSEKYTGVWGESGGGASGVYGKSDIWRGVFGESDSNTGVVGTSNSGFGAHGASKSNTGVVGMSDTGYGITGECKGSFPGVRGTSNQGRGVEGWSQSGNGVWGLSRTGNGVEGASEGGDRAGVFGSNQHGGDGVVGVGRRGVVGVSDTYQGVYGKSGDNAGVVGESDRMHAVFAISHSPTSAGVYGTNSAGGNAALFEGNVTVTGDLILAGADVAEQFEVADDDADLQPGSVAVLNEDGRLRTSDHPYDTRVAGIVSGAGDRAPAMVLDRQLGASDKSDAVRVPLAVAGKAWCLADASSESIRVGDLLTTAALPGHAMRASRRIEAIGAMIGKALTPLHGGTGAVLVLVGLG